MRDSDGEDDEVDEKPSKKKSKQKQKPVKEENFPGKYVLLKPQVVEEDEADEAESSAIRTVRCFFVNEEFLTNISIFRLGTKSEFYQRKSRNPSWR